MTIQKTIDEFVVAAQAAGWHIVSRDNRRIKLPAAISNRYPTIPDEFPIFLKTLSRCANNRRDAWFFCLEDYRCKKDAGRNWNGYENISLDSFDGDESMIANITGFWDRHLPVAYAVHSDLAYLALAVSGKNKGAVFYGYGPEFESSARKIASSLSTYLAKLTGLSKPASARSDKDVTCVVREFADFT